MKNIYIRNESEHDHDDDDEFEPAGEVKSLSNKIFFYADVNTNTILALRKAIFNLNVALPAIAERLSLETIPPIELHINSLGGDLFDGLNGTDAILASKVPVWTYVEGSAASAATFLSVVGAKRFITTRSHILIHQLSSGVWGSYETISQEKTNLDKFMKVIYELYKKYTKIPPKQLKEILVKDLWWDAETCLKYGIVDEIK